MSTQRGTKYLFLYSLVQERRNGGSFFAGAEVGLGNAGSIFIRARKQVVFEVVAGKYVHPRVYR